MILANLLRKGLLLLGSVWALSCGSGPAGSAPRFEVLGVRTDESVRDEPGGRCRGFHTTVTVATSSGLYRDTAGLLRILVRDVAPTDREGGGQWMLKACLLLPTTKDIVLNLPYAAGEQMQPGVDKEKFTAWCEFSVQKGCFNEAAGGDMVERRPIERKPPKYEFAVLSWSVEEATAELVQ